MVFAVFAEERAWTRPTPDRGCVAAETMFGRMAAHGFPTCNTGGRMVRTERYKYIMYSWGANREQPFDMDRDPGEMVNLAVEDRYSGLLEQHRDILRRWMGQTADRIHMLPLSARSRPRIVPGD